LKTKNGELDGNVGIGTAPTDKPENNK